MRPEARVTRIGPKSYGGPWSASGSKGESAGLRRLQPHEYEVRGTRRDCFASTLARVRLRPILCPSSSTPSATGCVSTCLLDDLACSRRFCNRITPPRHTSTAFPLCRRRHALGYEKFSKYSQLILPSMADEEVCCNTTRARRNTSDRNHRALPRARWSSKLAAATTPLFSKKPWPT
jgi:hypothetical protein